jgi:peroxiredoxin Q/BCP
VIQEGQPAPPFILRSDNGEDVSLESMLGKKYMGVERSTFDADADGNLAKVMRRVQPDTHADEVLAALSSAATGG